MDQPGPGLKLLPSVFDRLGDPPDDPASSDLGLDRPRYLRQIQSAVERDLEDLLNCKRAFDDFGPYLGELNRSLLAFGMPDLGGQGLGGDRGVAVLLRALEETITRFEPRLSRVRVRVDERRADDQDLRFQIEALLRVEPEPEPVRFATVLRLDTRTFDVRSGGG